MRRDRVSPRSVWITWSGMVAALCFGLGLWLVHALGRGIPGPTVAGVYIGGPVDVTVLIVYIMAAASLATVAAVMVARVPGNLIGWVLGAVAAWMVATFVVIMGLYFLHFPGEAGASLANWLGAWTFVLFVPTSVVLMLFPDGTLPSPRWRALPVLAIVGTAGSAAEATGEGLGLRGELDNPYANQAMERVTEPFPFS